MMLKIQKDLKATNKGKASKMLKCIQKVCSMKENLCFVRKKKSGLRSLHCIKISLSMVEICF